MANITDDRHLYDVLTKLDIVRLLDVTDENRKRITREYTKADVWGLLHNQEQRTGDPKSTVTECNLETDCDNCHCSSGENAETQFEGPKGALKLCTECADALRGALAKLGVEIR